MFLLVISLVASLPLGAVEVPGAEGFPRVVRRDGLVCVQTQRADGSVEESCRRGTLPAPPAVEDAAEVDERPGVRLESSVVVGPALELSSGQASGPLFGIRLTETVAFATDFGLVGLASGLITASRAGATVTLTLAPGFRVGRDLHLDVAAGPSVLSGRTSLLGGTVLVSGGLGLGRLSLVATSGVTIGATGVDLSLGAGLVAAF